jgi:DNA processing protein
MTGCAECRHRPALLAALAGHLEHLHAERGMFDEVLAVDDEKLLHALVSDSADRRRIAARARALRSSRALVEVCRHDRRYPSVLRDLTGPPATLFVLGSERFESALAGPAVAIVGSRRASAYGLEVARSLSRGLSASGVTVVSGMAFGIDAAAHEGALAGGGTTVAVLAGGADVPYPRSKRALHAEIARRGVVVSEMPPGFAPRRWCFPARNRIIAALAAVTVVVEAADRSGALITARIARELGRDVGAVPGRITSPLAAGANALIRDGAHLVDSPQGILDLLFGVGARPAVPPRDDSKLEPRLRVLLDRVRRGEDTAGALAGAQGDPGAVMAALGELELAGFVRRAPGGAYVALP